MVDYPDVEVHMIKRGFTDFDVMVNGYNYLARSFLGGPLSADAQVGRDWIKKLESLDADEASRITTIVKALDDPGYVARTEEEFTSYVLAMPPISPVPPYASYYLDEVPSIWGEATRDAVRFYSRAELHWSASAQILFETGEAVAPDHIGMELAFVAVGEEQMAQEPEQERTAVIRNFLREHLSRWLPGYVSTLVRCTNSVHYLELGRWARRWVEMDIENRSMPLFHNE